MAITLTLEVSRGDVVLSWTDTDAAPAGGWQVFRQEFIADVAIPDTFLQLATVTYEAYREPLILPTEGDQYGYQVKNPDSGQEAQAYIPFRFGKVDPLVSAIRYTDLAQVKTFLNINPLDQTKDPVLTQTIISVETAIDQTLGRGFPDPTPGGEIKGIPEAVKYVALSASVAAYTNITGPFGTAGSDDWFGSQDLGIGELVRREIQRNPVLLGYQVSWGVA